MVRQITMTDFPASWQAERLAQRSHVSRFYGKRFMLRLDTISQTKLRQLITQFGASTAEIVRQLVTQATPEDFPKSWQLRPAERSASAMRQQTRHHRQITR